MASASAPAAGPARSGCASAWPSSTSANDGSPTASDARSASPPRRASAASRRRARRAAGAAPGRARRCIERAAAVGVDGVDRGAHDDLQQRRRGRGWRRTSRRCGAARARRRSALLAQLLQARLELVGHLVELLAERANSSRPRVGTAAEKSPAPRRRAAREEVARSGACSERETTIARDAAPAGRSRAG